MTDENQVSDDDWAAAMGEQTTAEADQTQDHTNVQSATDVFEQLTDDTGKPDGLGDFNLILDIPVTLTVELGRTRMSIRYLLQLSHGSVVELEGLAGEPLDILVNGTLIAQGEVVVVNEKFGIRLTDVITPAERLNKIHR